MQEATAVTAGEDARIGKERLLLDIATVTDGDSSGSRSSAQLLTDGLSPGEAEQEAEHQRAPPTP